jgi:hypothetical protein
MITGALALTWLDRREWRRRDWSIAATKREDSVKAGIKSIVWICAALWTAACAGQASEKTDVAKGLSERRLELIRRRVESLQAVGQKEEKHEFSKEPMLRYNDAARDIVDAALWSLGRKGRPRAVLVLEVYGGSFVQYELTAVAEPPRSVRAPGFVWSPRETPFTWSKIPEFERPRGTTSLRRRQIRQASQRFSASEQWRGQTIQLNLQSRPILEYEDKELGVLDGALFVLAHGTNVEILMFIEARADDGGGGAHWVAGFSRLAAASLDVKFNGKDFWSSGESLTAGQTTPYFFHTEAVTADERAQFEPKSP